MPKVFVLFLEMIYFQSEAQSQSHFADILDGILYADLGVNDGTIREKNKKETNTVI